MFKMQNQRCHISQFWAPGFAGGRVMKTCPSQLQLSAKLCLPGDQTKFRAIELFCRKHESFGPLWHCTAKLPRCLHMNYFSWLLCLSRIYESFCSQQRSFDLPILSLFTSTSWFLLFTSTLIPQVLQLYEVSQRLTCQ